MSLMNTFPTTLSHMYVGMCVYCSICEFIFKTLMQNFRKFSLTAYIIIYIYIFDLIVKTY